MSYDSSPGPCRDGLQTYQASAKGRRRADSRCSSGGLARARMDDTSMSKSVLGYHNQWVFESWLLDAAQYTCEERSGKRKEPGASSEFPNLGTARALLGLTAANHRRWDSSVMRN